MLINLNHTLILEDFSQLREEMIKRQKMGLPPMTADEKHKALLVSQGNDIANISKMRSTKGLRDSVNSNPNSDMGGSIDPQEAARMIRRLKASGNL